MTEVRYLGMHRRVISRGVWLALGVEDQGTVSWERATGRVAEITSPSALAVIAKLPEEFTITARYAALDILAKLPEEFAITARSAALPES
jgi:hypothetical protein